MAGRIHDSRAFIGALALLIVGTILSLMVAFYLLPGVFGREIFIARWWWEIVLNLQILCLAFMWFCHHERIIQASGLWRLRAIGNFLVGIISVSYPIGVMLVSAWFDWFRHAPSEHTVLIVMIAGISLWVFGDFLMPVFYRMALGPEGRTALLAAAGDKHLRWFRNFWPTYILVGCLGYATVCGGLLALIPIPILMYMQGAIPYLRKAKHASPRDADI
ncbi:hypothetical protein [Kordiimonas marina]|uniref:hypothetical protein n=1 Tax=Kordiimonas marina TaxID=2872312 RepID=UPI001FF40D10|nr:hypothetical protein [Kordiimonas marina]MCJ9429712.1 hypothetical protein [Kordiimonas marina]